jgi:subfamily B ATP-binding cassette protein MsbA
MLLYGAASAAVAYLVKPIIDEALPGGGNLPFWATAILVAYLAKGLGAYFSAFLMTDIGQRVVRDLRDQLFRHTLDQSAEFFSQRTTGQLMSRVTNDVSQVQQAVSETIGDLLREGLALFGYAALLFYWDYRLALVCITGAPIVVYPLVRFGQRVRRTSRRSHEELEHLSHITAEAFTGHRIVKAFGTEEHEARRFRRATERLYRTNLKVTSTVAMLPPLMEFLGGLAVVALVWYGSRRIGSGEMTQGNFLAFIFAAFMMYTPIKKLSRVNTNLQQAIAAAERIFEMLDTHSEVKEREGARPLETLRRSVEFRNVSFAYGGRDLPPKGGSYGNLPARDLPPRGASHGNRPDAAFILQDVSFRVRAGEVVAIVGLSGAGKTTLVNLIPRFYDATGGAILVDDVDIRDVTLRSLRAQVGIVTQETVLFDDSIASNIAYGSPNATREQIEAAARAAHAHEFVMALPQGYDTDIGERGQRLSGGQRQRLAIARALLKNSPILILDEATSSLDAESEQLVQDALANLMRNRTAFVIAHRLSTVRRADKIVALERGRVAEIGTHDELLARGGVYAKLYSLQIFDRESETGAAVPPEPSGVVAGSGGSTA